MTTFINARLLVVKNFFLEYQDVMEYCVSDVS